MPTDDDGPPVLGSWRALYVVVLGVLAGLVGVFTLISCVYR